MIGIYKITSPTGKIYIGQSVNIKNRIRRYKNIDCKAQKKLYNSLNKHGWNNHNFEILLECEISELNEKERYYQELFNCISKNGLNLMLTKTDSKRQVMTKEQCLRISERNKNRVYTEKTKKLISDSAKERYSIKNNHPMSNKKHTDSAKLKMSNIKKGIPTLSVEKHINSKIVLDTQTGVFYHCATELAKLYNIKKSTLTKQLSGINKNNTQFIYA